MILMDTNTFFNFIKMYVYMYYFIKLKIDISIL